MIVSADYKCGARIRATTKALPQMAGTSK